MEIVDRRVPLSQIGKIVGPSPVQRFLGNIKRNGVVVPVLLQEVVGDGGEVEYRIIDGNRRVSAARKAGLQDVPARVFVGISADDAARLTLAGNNFRSENDITEFWAIKHLERSGVMRGRIATDAGLTIKSLDLRNRWSALDRRIFVGYANGRISATVARKISRLPQEDQKSLGDLFAVRGRLQTDDVEALQQPKSASRSTQIYENDLPVTPHSSPVETSSGGLHQHRVESISTTSATAVIQPPASPDHTAQPLASGHQQSDDGEYGDRSVRIVTASVTPKSLCQPDRPMSEGLPDDIQRSVDQVARLGSSRGIALDDLVDALTIAYRHMEFATKVTKEAVRGRDHQS